MTVFNTSSASHLVSALRCDKGTSVIKKFSDGEIYVRVDHKVLKAWVIASTFPPSDTLIELFFLLDALRRQNVTINLLLPYFGYARQSHPQPGESASAQVICNFLKMFDLHRIVIIHIHTATVHQFLTFENVIPFELICKEAENFDAIAASDKGSAKLAEKTGIMCSKPTIYIEKSRPAHEEVEVIAIKGDVENKRILIVDDIIATGNTIISAARHLKEKGAKSVSAYATHAIFSRSALENIEESVLDKVYVTNTIPLKDHGPKVIVLDIVSTIQKIIDQDFQ